jgi:heme/copper-type cytochrome/quinol oxidase subunit 4
LLNDGQRSASALDRVQAAALRELVVHSGACDHVGLLLEVELTVVKLILVIDEQHQRECLLLMVFVLGFK